MNCRAGAGAGAVGASGKWQRQFCLHWPHIVPASRQRYLLYLWDPLICTFARLRLPLPFAVDFRRFPTNDCPFFGRATGQQDKRTPSTASHLLLLFQACRKCLLFCPSPVAPISRPGLLFCAPARVYNFSCFTAVVRLPCPFSLVSLLCSAFFSSFLLLFI